VPRLCEEYPGICLTTEEKSRKTSVRVAGEWQYLRLSAVTGIKESNLKTYPEPELVEITYRNTALC